MMTTISMADQNLVCVASLKVTTNTTEVYLHIHTCTWLD